MEQSEIKTLEKKDITYYIKMYKDCALRKPSTYVLNYPVYDNYMDVIIKIESIYDRSNYVMVFDINHNELNNDNCTNVC
jgi:hypothetical protein